nr:STAS domain-containing protein [Lysinibacillus timonensis]
MLLQVDSLVEGSTLIIRLKGILDYTTADSFYLNESISEDINEIEVDFSQLEFIDSTGIGAILSIIHVATSFRSKVKFTGMSNQIVNLFETIGLFEIKKSLLDGDNHDV